MCGGCGSAPAADWAGELLRTPSARAAAAGAVERWCAAAGTRVRVAWSATGWCARWPTGRTDVAGSLTDLWRALERRTPVTLPEQPCPEGSPAAQAQPGSAAVSAPAVGTGPGPAPASAASASWPPPLPGRSDVVLVLDADAALVGAPAAVLDDLAPGAGLLRAGSVEQLRERLDACAADPLRRSTAVAATLRIGPGPAWLADTRLRGGRLVVAEEPRALPGAPVRRRLHRDDPADLPALVAWMTGLDAAGAGRGRAVTASCGGPQRVELHLVDGRPLPARLVGAVSG